MQILFLLISALAGGFLGYFFFYRRYENRELVNELRKYNLELKHTLQSVDRDRLEYEQQNIILKEEISILYQKNDDLVGVVSELSRYYYHLKKISGKMTALSRDLQQPLEDLDDKISPFSEMKSEYSNYGEDDEDDLSKNPYTFPNESRQKGFF